MHDSLEKIYHVPELYSHDTLTKSVAVYNSIPRFDMI